MKKMKWNEWLKDRETERKRERESDNIASVFISVWINIVGYCKTNNHVTFKRVILNFASFTWKLNAYYCIKLLAFLRRSNINKYKQIKKSGKCQHLKKWIS